jgi:hypothetical protein
MNDLLGPVSAALEEDLRAAISRGGLVVWLDADDHYSGFVDRLIARRAGGNLPYCDVKAYRGSHLELMLALENSASGVDKPALVVHMPGYNAETIERTPMLEAYRAGARYHKALGTLITDAAAGIAAPEAIDEFLKSARTTGRPGEGTLERADAWLMDLAVAREVGLRGTLMLMRLPALIDDLLQGGKIAEQIKAADNLRALWAHLEAVTGLSAAWREAMLLPQKPGPGEPSRRLAEEVAFAAASWALAVEYVDDLRREAKDPRLVAMRSLPRAVLDACRGLAEHLRRAQPEFYQRTAQETEDVLPDEVAAARAEDLGRIDTFEFEEKKVYEAALAALDEGRWEVARTWAQERLDGSSFWIELRGSLRRPAWEVVRSVATLGQALAAAGPALAADSLEAAVQRYVHSGASVDQAHRTLEQRWHGVSGALLPGREVLRARVVKTRELWHAWADAWARDFSALCKARGFVPAPALQQRTLFEEVVRPLTAATGTTVVFLVDALRYEMAEALRRELGEPGATTIELRARLAELPSITAVGMNALAPVSERGKLRPALRDGAIVGLQRGEYRVDNPDSRKRAMHERVATTKCPSMSLDELFGDEAALKNRIAGAKLALVHVDAIDSAGEKGNGLMVFELVLQRLRSACNLLREAGARRFVITADHGFLLLDDAVRQTQAHGRKIDPWRRHVLSPVAADHAGEVRVPLAQLDYEGVDGLQLMMPEGIAVFDIGKRTLSFVHGGGSLQERVIPVLTIVHRSGGAGGDTMAYGVKARAQEGVAGLHSIAAKVHVLAQHALDFGGRRQVELALQVEGEAEVQVDNLQTRGGAVMRAGSIVATVDADFEVFFRLVGPQESRVRVALVHPMHEVEVAACVLEEFFTVSALGVRAEPPAAAAAPVSAKAPGAAEAPKPAATGRAWLEAFADAGVRELFEHLAAHGVVTEDQAAKMLGGARGVRRFSGAFEEHIKKAPFIVRIETVGGVKRYVREGQER